ncbi:MAG: YncE family protein [Oligoflexales bacterium]
MFVLRLMTLVSLLFFAGCKARNFSDTKNQSAGHGGIHRYLYVANDLTAEVDIFDISNHHAPVHSFKADLGLDKTQSLMLSHNDSDDQGDDDDDDDDDDKNEDKDKQSNDDGESGKMRYRGITASARTGLLYLSDSDSGRVGAYDLKTEQLKWAKKLKECPFPDRLNLNKEGTELFIPCKTDPEQHVVVNAETGEFINKWPMEKFPHNSFTGEQGKYIYLSGYRNPTLYAIPQDNPRIAMQDVKKISGFKNPKGQGVRPFSVDKEERFVFTTQNDRVGFGVGDIEKGSQIFWIDQTTPAERTKHKSAKVPLKHKSANSHGIAVRPNSREVWFLDDMWGYLYVFDTSPLYQGTPKEPVHLANVPLWTDVNEPWEPDLHWRWVASNIEGDYIYPGVGSVVDADTKKVIQEKITPSEKLIEIQFQGSDGDLIPVRVSGQNGGVYE